MLFPKIIRLLKDHEAGDIVVMAGGIIPEKDIPKMKKVGIAEIFPPGSSTQDIIRWIKDRIGRDKLKRKK